MQRRLLVETIYMPVFHLILYSVKAFWHIWSKAQQHSLLSVLQVTAVQVVGVVNISFSTQTLLACTCQTRAMCRINLTA